MDFKTYTKDTDTDGRNIADLCRMCGQCCIAIATDFSYDELLDMAQNGEKEAQVFIEFFEKYETIDHARKIAPEHVNQVLRFKCLPETLKGDEVPFYYCTKILPDKRCSMHEQRPLCCRQAPKDGWSVMPPKCGYAGWQYEERERLKNSIRALREKVYEIETLEGQDAFVAELNMNVKEVKEYINEKAKPFKMYGSAGW